MTNTTNDWDLIVATLHHTGADYLRLPSDALARVWAKGDGYGGFSAAELRSKELLGDWSHIRDSSPEGEKAVAAQIRVELALIS